MRNASLNPVLQHHGVTNDISVIISDDGSIRSPAPEHFLRAFGFILWSVFALKPTDVDLAERFIADYIFSVSLEWNCMHQPNLEMVRFLMRPLKTTAPGFNGISNLAWKNGGDHLAIYVMDLVETFCGDGVPPADINSSYAFLDKKPEALAAGHTPAMIFRHPLDTRPLSSKQADHKQVAKVRNFCFSLVVETIDTQRGFIHGRQLAQNVIDLGYQARMDAFVFGGEGGSILN